MGQILCGLVFYLTPFNHLALPPPPAFAPPPLTSELTPFVWGRQKEWSLLAATRGAAGARRVVTAGKSMFDTPSRMEACQPKPYVSLSLMEFFSTHPDPEQIPLWRNDERSCASILRSPASDMKTRLVFSLLIQRQVRWTLGTGRNI